MQFIAIERGAEEKCPKWSVPQPARDMLLQLKTPIRIVSIVGEYRQGKSLLANLLADDPNHFQTSANVKAQTKGLWIATRPTPGTNVVVIDTEGINAPDSTLTLDTNLMALAVLFSSKVIYNCKHALGAHSFDGLQCAIETAQWLTSHSGATAQQTQPQLLWLLRDFILSLHDSSTNKTLTPTQYLEELLEKNATQTGLKQSLDALFSHRACFTMPVPTNNPKDLAKMENLTPAFNAAVRAVVADVQRTPAKMLDGAEITGPVLVAMADAMCQLLSAGKAPEMHTIAESVRLMRSMEAKHDVLRDFERSLADLSSPVPKLSFWEMDVVKQRMLAAAAKWEKSDAARTPSNTADTLLACVDALSSMSQSKLEVWTKRVGESKPDVAHLLPAIVRSLVDDSLARTKQIEAELAQAREDCTQLKITNEHMLAFQPEPTDTTETTSVSEEELNRYKDEVSELQSQNTQLTLVYTTFQTEFAEALAQSKQNLQQKTEQLETEHADLERIRSELKETQHMMQNLNQTAEIRNSDLAAARAELAKFGQKRMFEDLETKSLTRQLETSRTQLDACKRRRDDLESENKRLKTDKSQLELELLQQRCKNIKNGAV